MPQPPQQHRLSLSPKSKPWFSFARYIVTALYVLTLIVSTLGTLGPYGQGLSAAFAALAVTVIYTLLMLLLWLYERFAPGSLLFLQLAAAGGRSRREVSRSDPTAVQCHIARLCLIVSTTVAGAKLPFGNCRMSPAITT